MSNKFSFPVRVRNIGIRLYTICFLYIYSLLFHYGVFVPIAWSFFSYIIFLAESKKICIYFLCSKATKKKEVCLSVYEVFSFTFVNVTA